MPVWRIDDILQLLFTTHPKSKQIGGVYFCQIKMHIWGGQNFAAKVHALIMNMSPGSPIFLDVWINQSSDNSLERNAMMVASELSALQ